MGVDLSTRASIWDPPSPGTKQNFIGSKTLGTFIESLLVKTSSVQTFQPIVYLIRRSNFSYFYLGYMSFFLYQKISLTSIPFFFEASYKSRNGLIVGGLFHPHKEILKLKIKNVGRPFPTLISSFSENSSSGLAAI